MAAKKSTPQTGRRNGRDGIELRAALEQQLGIGYGQTTPDQRFTLLPVCCLGACDRGPTLMIDDDLHGAVAPGAVADLVVLLALVRGAGGAVARCCCPVIDGLLGIRRRTTAVCSSSSSRSSGNGMVRMYIFPD